MLTCVNVQLRWARPGRTIGSGTLAGLGRAEKVRRESAADSPMLGRDLLPLDPYSFSLPPDRAASAEGNGDDGHWVHCPASLVLAAV